MVKPWDLLFDTLLGGRDELAGRVVEGMQAELPAYRVLPREVLYGEVGLQIERIVRSARAGRAAVNESELAELAAIGEERAQQAIPIAELLRAWRIGIEVVVDSAREAGRSLGIDATQVLELVQSTLAWSDVAMATIAGAHRKVELLHAERGWRAVFARRVLFGEIPAAELRFHAEAFGLDPAGEYVAVRAGVDENAPANKIEKALGFGDLMRPSRGLCAPVDHCIVGFLGEPPSRDFDGVVGYGPACQLEQLAESYRLATRAHLTAQACGLRGAHDIESLGLRPAVVTDADVGESLRKRYLIPLAAHGSARELVSTVHVYLTCGTNVEQTAARLLVHQNTVRYRLARFEELTGADLHDTEVLFEVWWTLERSAMGL